MRQRRTEKRKQGGKTKEKKTLALHYREEREVKNKGETGREQLTVKNTGSIIDCHSYRTKEA
jgi:hypothetical protein